MNYYLLKNFDEKGNRLIVLFLCGFFAPLWGVGYVLPFLLPFFFFLIKDIFLRDSSRIIIKHSINSNLIVFVLFLCLVLLSSVYHRESKWGSTEGFWVVFSSFLYFFFGTIVGIMTRPTRLAFYLKLYFCLGFSILILTVLNFKSFRGGIWGEMNDLTTAVLMITGALSGIFLDDLRNFRNLATGVLLLSYISFALYFSVKISSSDAALALLVGVFFFLSILAPSGRSFAIIWSFSLFMILAGVIMLVVGKPLNFKSLLEVKKLESFLSFRPQAWFASISIIGDNPWLGIGSGQYKQFYEALLPLLPGKKIVLSHSHSLFLAYFVAHGIAAGLAFTTLLMLNIRLVISALKDSELAPFGLMTASIWFFALSYGLVELTPASREIVPLVWGTTGLLAGLKAQKFLKVLEEND